MKAVNKYVEERGLPERKNEKEILRDNISHLRDLIDSFRQELHFLTQQVDVVENQFKFFEQREKEKERELKKRQKEVDDILQKKGVVLPHREDLVTRLGLGFLPKK